MRIALVMGGISGSCVVWLVFLFIYVRGGSVSFEVLGISLMMIIQVEL